MKTEKVYVIDLKCPKEICSNEWTYKGVSKYKASCPKCHSCVLFKKCEVKK